MSRKYARHIAIRSHNGPVLYDFTHRCVNGVWTKALSNYDALVALLAHPTIRDTNSRRILATNARKFRLEGGQTK